MSQELVTAHAEQTAVVVVTPMTMIELAVKQGANVDQLQKLFELQLAWEKNEARKAFVTAMARFKENPPNIYKNKAVDFTSPKGRTHYKHATLDNVCDAIGDALAKVGIMHNWEPEHLENGLIRITCVLTHSLGHATRTSLQAGRDDSGNKNTIQGVQSTVTSLSRYTLLAATGMAVKDSDDDGAGGHKGMAETVKADFSAQIEALQSTDAAKTLWQAIAKACHECNDLAAHDALKEQLLAKRKALEGKNKEQMI